MRVVSTKIGTDVGALVVDHPGESVVLIDPCTPAPRLESIVQSLLKPHEYARYCELRSALATA